jgi:hypothetical protein
VAGIGLDEVGPNLDPHRSEALAKLAAGHPLA